MITIGPSSVRILQRPAIAPVRFEKGIFVFGLTNAIGSKGSVIL